MILFVYISQNFRMVEEKIVAYENVTKIYASFPRYDPTLIRCYVSNVTYMKLVLNVYTLVEIETLYDHFQTLF